MHEKSSTSSSRRHGKNTDNSREHINIDHTRFKILLTPEIRGRMLDWNSYLINLKFSCGFFYHFYILVLNVTLSCFVFRIIFDAFCLKMLRRYQVVLHFEYLGRTIEKLLWVRQIIVWLFHRPLFPYLLVFTLGTPRVDGDIWSWLNFIFDSCQWYWFIQIKHLFCFSDGFPSHSLLFFLG